MRFGVRVSFLGMKKNKETTHVAAAYDSIAGRYDHTVDPFYLTNYEEYDRLLGRWLQCGPFGRALDAGCGSGIQTAHLAGAAAQVVGLDISQGLLRIAAEKLQAHANVNLVAADLARVPLQSGVFDAVISYGDVVSHIPDYKAALAEIARVAREGAVVSVEVDNKWYFGLFYKPAELWRACTRFGGHFRIWGWTDDDGQPVAMRFRTFTRRELSFFFRSHGLEPLEFYGLNILKCLLPEGVLYQKPPFTMAGRVAVWLGRLDHCLATRFPWNRLGFNVVVTARKRRA